ncbi:methylthioribose-1-phosphate isomerase [Blastocystis sp. subtype 4]|uniref:methylthioribose-1-phosphate isomerase n=1 Tax=Blastocystis sp. subtype 4 TaxID=944170 RepID=UPI000711B0F1|nr:methylthioribose-1-phosphate isomerase [Blastocystis sp. subtype 4]KNB44727.1 methylthioribose-1-phosphate isomerase [Blastocystis sp. subtype 4]|eukprot:XP_014528162.1 methylthioribose-1-phosphate isomerase [Blastocystis sp. subtype 4]
MTIRGAPAIGVAGAYGMVLAVHEKKPVSKEQLLSLLRDTKVYLDSSRPTAVNLMWATERVIREAEGFEPDDFEGQMIRLAQTMADEDVQINKQMAQYGASLIPQQANVIHHCNTGALATVDIGTALGVIYECHLQGKNIHVWVDETRPRLQGARLTAWELHQSKIPYHLMADGASGLLMRTHKIDCVLFGADRVAANGDVANKIGTYNLAVVAHTNHVPVYAVVPTSTIDLKLASGDQIPIEFRGKSEVISIEGNMIAPSDSDVYNPAFDVTPHEFITAIVTEKGICYPPFSESLRDILSYYRDCSTNKIKNGCTTNTSNYLYNVMIAPNE